MLPRALKEYCGEQCGSYCSVKLRGKALFGLLLLGGIWNRKVVCPGISLFHFPDMDYCPEIIVLRWFLSLKIMQVDHTFSLTKILILFAWV